MHTRRLMVGLVWLALVHAGRARGEAMGTPPAVPAPGAIVVASAADPGLAQGSRNVLELDAAPFYSLIWGHAPGVWLGLGLAPRGGGLGARVIGSYQAGRDVMLEGGSTTLLRSLIGATATYDLQRTHVWGSGDLGLAGSFTHGQGSGYQVNRGSSSTNLGGLAGLRAGLRVGRFRLGADARLVRLAHAETVMIQTSSPGVGDRAVLSPWDVQLGVGLGFRFE